jgi:hypothetical protein
MNIIKKVEGAKNNGLREGERVLAAISVNDDGAISRAAISGGVGGLLGIFIGSKMQKSAQSKNGDVIKTELSEKMPYGVGFIAVTDTRIALYSADLFSGKAKELKAELKKGDFKIEKFEKGKLSGSLVLIFADGGRRVFDVPKGNDLDAFQAVL